MKTIETITTEYMTAMGYTVEDQIPVFGWKTIAKNYAEQKRPFDKQHDSFKWIPFNKETGTYLNTLENPLLLFDNEETCRYDDDHPFALMTHFLPIPPKP